MKNEMEWVKMEDISTLSDLVSSSMCWNMNAINSSTPFPDCIHCNNTMLYNAFSFTFPTMIVFVGLPFPIPALHQEFPLAHHLHLYSHSPLSILLVATLIINTLIGEECTW